MNQFKEHCKLLITTRVNKKYDCDTYMPNPETSDDFSVLHVSKTFSQDDITFDFALFGNNTLLAEQPELIPTKFM